MNPDNQEIDMTTHTRNIDGHPALVDNKGKVLLWLDGPVTLGRQGTARKPLGEYKRRMFKPLKGAPANVIGRVNL